MRQLLVSFLGLCLVVTGCGGGDASGAIDAADRPQSFDDLEYKSPIADFLGIDTSVDFSSDESQAEFIQEQREAEESIATCMRAQGFEYTPVDQSTSMTFGIDSEELAYFSDEWVAKYGFGISTQRFAQSEVGPNLVGFDDSAGAMEAEEFVDPNQPYVDSLSQPEQDAYYEALYGTQPDIPVDATEEEMNEIYANFEPTGCQAESQSDFFAGPEQQFYEQFGTELEAIYERVESDQRVIDYRAEVTACAAEAGFTYTTMGDLYSQFEDKLTGVGPNWESDPLVDAGLDPLQMTDEEINEFYQSLNVLDDADRATLAEVQTEEVALAQAVIGCGGGWLNEEVILGDVRVELEQEFLDVNRDRLAEFENSAG